MTGPMVCMHVHVGILHYNSSYLLYSRVCGTCDGCLSISVSPYITDWFPVKLSGSLPDPHRCIRNILLV